MYRTFSRWIIAALVLLLPVAAVPARAQTEWTPLLDDEQGLERRILPLPGIPFGTITLIRIDPELMTIRAHYSPTPRTVIEWEEALDGAHVIVNANLFQPDYSLIGILIEDGEITGRALEQSGGGFYVNGEGVVSIRYNAVAPYDPEEDAFVTAVQAYPMLVHEGEVIYHQTDGDRQTRRTAIAIDDEGRILIAVTPLLGPRLADLARFLVEAELGIVHAFNLDGGGSSMLSMPDGTRIVSRDPVPAVLAIYPRHEEQP